VVTAGPHVESQSAPPTRKRKCKAGFVDDSLALLRYSEASLTSSSSTAGKRQIITKLKGIIADMKSILTRLDFSCYRRQVQMLAQKGRLAVVFSDDALAYGVNILPFVSLLW
jgi:hypothetical protein